MNERPIILELNAQEAQWLAEFLDSGLRFNGLKALAAANVLNAKLVAALKASPEPKAVQPPQN